MFNDPAKNTLPELCKSLAAISMSAAEPVEKYQTHGQLPRAASYTYLPSAASPRPRANSSASVVTSRPRTQSSASNKSARSNRSTASNGSKSTNDERIRMANFAPAKEGPAPDTSYHAKTSQSPTKSILKGSRKPRMMPDSLANLAKRPWGSDSRSPSPKPRQSEQVGRPEKPPKVGQSPLAGLQEHQDENAPDAPPAPRPNHLLRSMSMKGAGLLKKSRKPPVPSPAKASDSGEDGNGPSASFLPRSMSSNNLALFAKAGLMPMPPPPLPTSSSTDRLNGPSMDVVRKKDELWAVFRALEHDFTK
jgi:hypothetical protein